ncbi:MAG: type IV pili twitching motility protein PilT, partial [Candidatus Omnitrophica bacterium]|nr:type IV pili twitching motility protein PilT [Candidatus Omnitrophota bacterium]
MVSITTLLKLTEEKGASDLHITVGNPPIVRIDGQLVMTDMPVLDSEATRNLVYSMLNDEQKSIFEKDKELDFSFALKDMDRFRVNVHIQKGNTEAALRRVPR